MAETTPEVRGTTHEEDNVDVRSIFGFGLALLVTGIIVSVLVWLLVAFFSRDQARRPAPDYPLAMQQEPRLPPEPRLQTNPRQDLLDLRAQEDAILHGYGWVDKNAGVVRIPIEAAMKLTVQRGLPSTSPAGKQ